MSGVEAATRVKVGPGRLLRVALLTVLGVLYLLHGLLLFLFGVASVLTSLFFFSTVAALSLGALGFAGRSLGLTRARRINLGLLLGSGLFSMAMADLYLRYGLARYAGYEERNGGFFFMPVHKPALLLRVRQHLTSSRLHVNRRHATIIRRKTEFSHEVITNSEGIRDREHSTTKPTGELRIVGMGDSFTEGTGASFAETWLQQLRRVLSDEGFSRIEVVSGGVDGSDPFFEYELLRDRLLGYAPDVVIVAINNSDIEESLVRGGMDRFKADGTIAYPNGPNWEWIYASSYLFRHVVHDVLGYDRLLLQPAQRAVRTRQAFDAIHDVLQSFAELARARGFSLLLVFHPLRHEVREGKLALADLVGRLEKEQRIATLDLLEYYRSSEEINEGNIDEYYWPLDMHHTPKGYRAFAQGVAAELLRRGWVQAACGAVTPKGL